MDRRLFRGKAIPIWVDVGREPEIDYAPVYFYLGIDPEMKPLRVVKRTQRLTNRVNLDFDESDRLIGIEVI